jgi:type II restriction/modification system DNA methylase subunit YeeA
MTPSAFIRKWKASNLKERSAAQEHFIDLCRLLDEPTPAEADPDGGWYCFERGASKLTGSDGWADVWKRGHFSWEYKGKHKDLKAAYVQLQQYSVALENPPLLVVCDMERFRIYTNWTNTVQVTHDITLDDLQDADQRQRLTWVFSDPERLKPGKTRQMLTEEAAEQFASLARRLRARGHDPQAVAHFINRLVFCMFAEDIGLLPNAMFSRMLDQAVQRPAEFVKHAQALFLAMQSGGWVGFEPVEWFNGGLFDTDEALPLDPQDTALVLKAARLDWSEIDPSIFGTLFERGLDPDKRSQLGAHYTDRDKIMMLIEPVIIRPLQAEWDAVKAQMAQQIDKAQGAKAASTRTRAWKAAQTLHNRFLERLKQVRVLDPACGSGNFLYLAILALKNLEHKVNLDAEAFGLGRQFPSIGPECVKGIEINPYAAELARVTVWIGEIQWMRRNGFDVERKPILRPLDTIECRDAVMNPDGTEAEWPEAEFVVGNPPFLGGSKMRGVLRNDYVDALREIYEGRVPGGGDLVTYWFEKARAAIGQGKTKHAGLVATNSIRGGANRKVLERINESGNIYEAWDDEPWVVEGAAVRVSLICFAAKEEANSFPHRLNGREVVSLNSDLSASTSSGNINLTQAKPLAQNKGISFQGSQKIGPFEIEGDRVRKLLTLPRNPNGRPNGDVIKRSWNGLDLTRRHRDVWIIDFGTEMPEADAALYEAPFEYVREHVYPVRLQNNRQAYRRSWWRHGEPRIAMRHALSKVRRYIATPHVAKHRIFAWLSIDILPDKMLIVIAREDNTAFGILHSRFHEIWALRLGTSLEDRPRYTPSTTFETFPFPKGLTLDIPAAEYADDPKAQKIAAAARRLDELRNNWLNPSDLIISVPEVVKGYPDRILPKDEAAAQVLKQRTLTNLYNERPTWLDTAHRELDAAVADAYGWKPDMADDEMLTKLLALHLERAKEHPRRWAEGNTRQPRRGRPSSDHGRDDP